jgi:hypothetical protein
MMSLPFETIQGSRLGRCSYSAAPKNKKTDVAEDPSAQVPQNLIGLGGRYSTTSAYSLANPPGRTGLFFI